MKTIIHSIQEGVSQKIYRIKEDSTLVLLAVKKQKVDATVSVWLQKPGVFVTIVGIVKGQGSADINIHTMQNHEAPNTTSNLLIKTALYDHARCVVDGGIRVEKHAQKTNAYQRNENLLLSEHAYAESKPSLEILANDVRCTHGATVGPVSEEELWYLETRGISKQHGESIIVHGFFISALQLISDEIVRNKIEKLIE